MPMPGKVLNRMIVTAVEELSKSKRKVYIDGEFAFVLYKGELRLYHICIGKEMENADYIEIMEKVLTKRARMRAMHLLTKKDYTEKQLSDKLKQGLYPQEVIQDALQYVAGFHYTDDLRFAVGYITDHVSSRSRLRIEQDLLQKGIKRDTLEQAWLEWENRGGEQDEASMIINLIEKRGICWKQADQKERHRVYRYLLGKGFSGETIQKALRSEDL